MMKQSYNDYKTFIRNESFVKKNINEVLEIESMVECKLEEEDSEVANNERDDNLEINDMTHNVDSEGGEQVLDETNNGLRESANDEAGSDAVIPLPFEESFNILCVNCR